METKEVKLEELGADTNDKSTIDAAVNAVLDARREFNIYFTTFWHLAHLATYASQLQPISASWYVIASAGKIWKNGMDAESYFLFDSKLTKELAWMEKKLLDKQKVTMNEKSIALITNYDKCLEIVKKLKDQVNHDEVDAEEVCAELVRRCNLDLESFQQLPLLWNHLFVSRTSQLLLLARNCYFDESLALAYWSEQHAIFAEKLRQHFLGTRTTLSDLAKPIGSISLVSSSIDPVKPVGTINLLEPTDQKLFSPTISLDELIVILNENAKRAIEQIPTAVTAIMHEYCYLDPFYINDVEFVKMKLYSH